MARAHEVRLPELLAHAIELLVACAGESEVFGYHRAPDVVTASHERLARQWVQHRDHRFDEVVPEAARKKHRQGINIILNYTRRADRAATTKLDESDKHRRS